MTATAAPSRPDPATLTSAALRHRTRVQLFTWEERYESNDLASARAGFDDGIADIAERLIGRFGGRVIERYMDAPR